MTIKEFYDNRPTDSLFINCVDIDSLGGSDLFDDITRMFYSRQGVNHLDKNNIYDYTLFKNMFITAWSMNLYFIKTLYNTMNLQYDPIENYRRNEKEYSINNNREIINEVGNRTDTTDVNETTFESTTPRLTSQNNNTIGSQTNKTYYNKDKQNTIDDTINGGTKTGDILSSGERLIYGNAGVTTTQQMIKEEREVADMNYYKIVIERLINTVCEGVF